MKKFAKHTSLLFIALILCCSFLLFGCQKNDGTNQTTYRFTAPEGTPALAILRLGEDNKYIDGKNMEYDIVAPSNIAAEMSSQKSDLVIMPVNAGANLIRQGAPYKLVSIAVDGSLYMVGRTEGGSVITFDDIIGKKVACIGKTGVPGLIFRYIMSKNNITILEEGEPNAENREIVVNYVADGPAARTLLADNRCDFAVVGEPAATTFLNLPALNLNASMNMQEEYKKANNNSVDNYPQAGLFVKNEIAENQTFMDALFAALDASKTWVTENPTSITDYAKENLYASAVFPPASIPNCAINAQKIDDTKKDQIIAFLKNVAPKDAKGNSIDWDAEKSKLF